MWFTISSLPLNAREFPWIHNVSFIVLFQESIELSHQLSCFTLTLQEEGSVDVLIYPSRMYFLCLWMYDVLLANLACLNVLYYQMEGVDIYLVENM
jgi:hypothetical protein